MVHKIRLGILGCANVVQKNALPAFRQVDDAEVLSIASRDAQKAKEWAVRFGIGYDESYDALVQRRDIDAVYIPLPIGLHKEWVLKAAAAGKHVFCEKSLAESFSSAKAMVDACRERGVVLMENFMCHYHPQHEQVQVLVKEGKIGKPFLFTGTFGFPPFYKNSFRYDPKLGGGCLNDAGAYTITMARRHFGEPLAATSMLVTDSDYPGVDVQGSVLLEFSGGKVAQLSFGFDNVYQNKYSIWGTKGLVTLHRAYSIPPELPPPVELLTNELFQEKVSPVHVPAAPQFQLIFREFCRRAKMKMENDSRVENGSVVDDFSEILAQARVLEAVRLSSRLGRKVRLTEIG